MCGRPPDTHAKTKSGSCYTRPILHGQCTALAKFLSLSCRRQVRCRFGLSSAWRTLGKRSLLSTLPPHPQPACAKATAPGVNPILLRATADLRPLCCTFRLETLSLVRVWAAPVATESVRDPASAAAAASVRAAFPSIESTERVLSTTGSAEHPKQSRLAIFRSTAGLSGRSSSSLPRFTACLVLPFLAPTI